MTWTSLAPELLAAEAVNFDLAASSCRLFRFTSNAFSHPGNFLPSISVGFIGSFFLFGFSPSPFIYLFVRHGFREDRPQKGFMRPPLSLTFDSVVGLGRFREKDKPASSGNARQLIDEHFAFDDAAVLLEGAFQIAFLPRQR